MSRERETLLCYYILKWNPEGSQGNQQLKDNASNSVKGKGKQECKDEEQCPNSFDKADIFSLKLSAAFHSIITYFGNPQNTPFILPHRLIPPITSPQTIFCVTPITPLTASLLHLNMWMIGGLTLPPCSNCTLSLRWNVENCLFIRWTDSQVVSQFSPPFHLTNHSFAPNSLFHRTPNTVSKSTCTSKFSANVGGIRSTSWVYPNLSFSWDIQNTLWMATSGGKSNIYATSPMDLITL